MMSPTAFEEEWRKGQKEAREGKAPPKPPAGAFHYDAERLLNVMQALEADDISGCNSADVQHAIEAMTRIAFLANHVPDMLDGFMNVFLRDTASKYRKAVIMEMSQSQADAEGYGQEWRESIEAGMSPNKKDYVAKLIAVLMKAEGISQNEAMTRLAAFKGTDPENIARQVKRTKKRERK